MLAGLEGRVYIDFSLSYNHIREPARTGGMEWVVKVNILIFAVRILF
jgi:hypothetical protein